MFTKGFFREQRPEAAYLLRSTHTSVPHLRGILLRGTTPRSPERECS